MILKEREEKKRIRLLDETILPTDDDGMETEATEEIETEDPDVLPEPVLDVNPDSDLSQEGIMPANITFLKIRFYGLYIHIHYAFKLT